MSVPLEFQSVTSRNVQKNKEINNVLLGIPLKTIPPSLSTKLP